MKRFPFLFIILFISVGLVLLLGLRFLSPETIHEFATIEMANAQQASKLRHPHLLDRAVRQNKAGKDGAAATVGLVIKINGLVSRFGIVSRYGLVSRFDYDNVFYGLAAELDQAALDSVLAQMETDPEIDWVEPDIFMGIDMNTYNPQAASGQVVPWGIDRVGGTQSWTASGDSTGTVTGVNVYVLDTGVRSDDINLVEEVNYAGTGTVTDEEGHGTHIAATIAAQDETNWVVGVAPGVNIHNIKVLDDTGQTDESNVIAGIEYVIGQKILNPNTPMVMNLSFGADIQTTEYNALDVAVNAAVEAGITVVVAAGNDGIDASTVTPAHVSSVITVGAIDVFNDFASFSNFGSAVDLLAPGVDVLSLALDGGGVLGRYLSSGTSMAAPHVAGAAALVLAQNPNASPQQVKDGLIATSIAKSLNVPVGTTENVLWVGPELRNIEAPPFFQYAVTTSGSFKLKDGNVFVGIEPGGSATQNANIYSGKVLEVLSLNNSIEGFGYFVDSLNESGGTVDGTFTPNFNPTAVPVAIQIEEIAVPEFDPLVYESLATQKSEDLELSGSYQLGTQDNPAIWFVGGNLTVANPATITGYGIFIVRGNVHLYDNLSIDGSGGETTVGIYNGGNFTSKADNVEVQAQIFSAGNVTLKEGNSTYGTITNDGNVSFVGAVSLFYRPASCVLTEAIWPVGNCTGGIPQPAPLPAFHDVAPFLRYALMTDSILELGQPYITIQTEAGANSQRNASIHSNAELAFEDPSALVEGFGYYSDYVISGGGQAQSILQPNYNPNTVMVHHLVDPVDIPVFDAATHLGMATQTLAGPILSGTYALGTWNNPVFWYVTDSLYVTGNTTFTGHGAIFVSGHVQFDADVSSDGGPDLSAVAIYADSSIILNTPGISVEAQLVANGAVTLASNTTLYGSIASKDDITLNQDVTVNYRRTACALTEPFWPTGNCNSQPLPVDLTRFEALVDGKDVQLYWETLSETNNAGFEIQRQSKGQDWVKVGFERGQGTTLEPQNYDYRVEGLSTGRHRFRLKQIDLNGGFDYSSEATVVIGTDEAYVLSPAYPNPFNPQVTFTLSIQQVQPVRIEVYDALGQRVAILFDGMLDPNQEHAFTFNAQDLPSGLYLYQVRGEFFQASKSVTLVK